MARRAITIICQQGFTLAIIIGVFLAFQFPELGISGGILKTEVSTKIAIAIIFLIQGLSLPTRQIIASGAKIKLHLCCQGTIFIAAPLLMLGFTFAFDSFLEPQTRMGFLFLAALPTTISSAIVMTSNSDGDASIALFSTAISNILGIAATPIICGLLGVTTYGSQNSMTALISKLALFMLLPIIAGQLLRPYFRPLIQSSKRHLKRFSNALIVFIVFAAFCNSVNEGIWNQFEFIPIVKTLALATLFLVLFSYFVWKSSTLVSGELQQRVALFYCGSQKTLAAGIPMASLIFASEMTDPNITYGILLLPLLCYHPLQLILAGILSPYFSKRIRMR